MRISTASALIFLAQQSLSQAFTIRPAQYSNQIISGRDSVKESSSELYGRKKGNLGKTVSTGGISTKKKKNNKKSKVDDVAPKVSNSLSQWASSLNSDSESISNEVASDVTAVERSEDAGATFAPFGADDETSTPTTTTTSTSSSNQQSKGNKSNRRERSTQRQQQSSVLNAKVDSVLASITELISSNNLPVDVLLSKIQSLAELQSPITLKALLNSNAKDYTLSWVGSDDAICHIGTGLHKVPLARLQDIFFTIGRDGSGQSKTCRLMEVISIFGPFPNVRNTLQGEFASQKAQESARAGDAVRTDTVKIMYDSMTDGLGKEIDAGTEDNVRYVDLDIVFASDNTLVCVVPTDDEENNGFGKDGKNVLLFLKEDDLDFRLEELRAA